jgi:uracil-DNA glycosylase
MKKLSRIIQIDRDRYTVLPDPEQVFRAYQLTPYQEVKIVILGQDPYPTPGHPNGLAFSMNEGSIQNMHTIPASLQNIFQEVEDDIGFSMRHDPDLTRWATQGVFLLNSSLSVVAGHPQSHQNIGWYHFIVATINALNKHKEQIIYLLWGRTAQGFIPLIRSPHEYFTAAHPSPRSAHRGFFGCKHFSKANHILQLNGREPINWLA